MPTGKHYFVEQTQDGRVLCAGKGIPARQLPARHPRTKRGARAKLNLMIVRETRAQYQGRSS
jgi:hypothetical protein